MNKIQIVEIEWMKSIKEVLKNQSFQMMLAGQLEKKHYQQILTQIFLYYRDIPQLHASATAYFHGSQRHVIQEFLYYSITKTDEVQLIVNDLKMVGLDIEKIKLSNPLPSTMAYTAFCYYQIQHSNPVSYLGLLFHNENVFVKLGKDFIFSFEKKSVSRQMMSFFCEQAIEDRNQRKQVSKYMQDLIVTNDDLDGVIYTARSSAYFLEQIIEQAIDSAEHAKDWGKSYIEYDYVNELNKYISDQNTIQ